MGTNEECIDEGHVDKNKLLELYSIVLEEARHHDRLYTQTWIGGVIALGIFLAVLSSAFEVITVLTLKRLLVLSALVLGYLMALAFYWSTCRHGREGRECRNIARNIEGILVGKTPEETIKLDMMKKVKEMRGPSDKAVWAPLVDPVWRLFFPVIILVLWIVVGVIFW